MNIHPIKSERDYQRAMKRVEALWDVKDESTEAADELDVLVTLVEAYEIKHWPIDPPAPIDAIRFAMEQRGMSQAELAKALGSRSHVSEVLTGKRPPSVGMIVRLREVLGISADVLLPASAGRSAR